jgi:HEAT repeat protein
MSHVLVVDDDAVISRLRDALMDDDPAVRALVAELVGVLGDIAATPALEVLLRDPEEDLPVREAAACALGRIGSPTSTEPLARTLTESPAPRLQRISAEALGRIGDPMAAVPLLAGMASADGAVRAACADALARLGSEGRNWLEEVAAGSGAAAEVARAALDGLDVGGRHLQAVGLRSTTTGDRSPSQ